MWKVEAVRGYANIGDERKAQATLRITTHADTVGEILLLVERAPALQAALEDLVRFLEKSEIYPQQIAEARAALEGL